MRDGRQRLPALARPEDEADLNNNRGNNNNNNRRRGRGNNNRPQGGGGRGEQLNRIDSRARGNAPQMLEKYRKLASDAHLNGDRVTAEYYLQFADHYFRVIADARLRQEEQRQRRDDRQPDDDSDDLDYGNDSDFPSFDQPPAIARRDDRRPARDEQADGNSTGGNGNGNGNAVEGEASAYEPAGGNPFTRNNRAVRGMAAGEAGERNPRYERRERRSEQAEPRTPEQEHGFDQDTVPPVINDGEETVSRSRASRGVRRREPIIPVAQEELGFDPAVLPPSIEQGRSPPAETTEAPAAPAPRRRGRRPKAAGDDAGSLEAVNG
jgi:hypothetical protein